MKNIFVSIIGMGLMALGGAAAACTTISSIPVTIDRSGDYCLSRSLTLAAAGTAINIRADDVSLDLRGYSLMSGVPTQFTQGVVADGVKNVTVKNGRLSSFFYGVQLVNKTGTSDPGNYLVEDLVLRNSHFALVINRGGNSIVRNNIISNTTPSASNPNSAVFAIDITSSGGLPVIVENNIVDTTRGVAGSSSLGARAIVVRDAPGSSITFNTLTNTIAGDGLDTAFGIEYWCDYNYVNCDTQTRIFNNMIINSGSVQAGAGIRIVGADRYQTTAILGWNGIENFETGVLHEGALSRLVKTRVVGATRPFVGGRNGGGNESLPR